MIVYDDSFQAAIVGRGKPLNYLYLSCVHQIMAICCLETIDN